MDRLVSVIVPYYNGERYIEAALRSVDAQTYGKIEIVVVDDNSETPAVEILEPFRDELQVDIHVIRHDSNRGISAARNTGIRESEGDYITILDQDDVFLPEKVEIQVDRMEKEEDLGMTMTNVIHIDQNGEELGIRDLESDIEEKETKELIKSVFKPWLENSGPLPLTTEMTRSCVYEEIGLYDTTLYGANDRDLLFRVASEYSISIINKPLLKKRYHAENSSNANRRLLEDRIRLTDTAVEQHPSLAKYSDKRLAFLRLLSVRVYILNRHFRAALIDFLRALRSAPLFCTKRTLYFPIKVLLGE